jgi:hypothetical protein
MLWVYAICDHPELPPPEPLHAVREGDLLAVFGEHAPSETSLDALWEHEQVVERLMADRAVLPMRFGTTVPGVAALAAAVAARHDSFVAALDRVRGRVELGVRAVVAEGSAEVPAPPAAQTGRDYLLAKLGADRAARDAADELHAPLAARAAAAQRRAAGAGEILRATYLVEEAGVPPFLDVVERLRHGHPDVSLLCTGPWPPYSFVGDPDAEPLTAPVQRSLA